VLDLGLLLKKEFTSLRIICKDSCSINLLQKFWRKKDSEKAELFRKIESYLTFLNVHQLERQGADIQTKVEELEELNQSQIQRDKVKDDAIAQLSDQLVYLSSRLREIERYRHNLKSADAIALFHAAYFYDSIHQHNFFH
jgi:hypothetical protein